MLIVISSELTLFRNGGNKDSWVKPLECRLEPLKVWVPPVYSFSKEGRLDKVADIRLFKESSLFFFKLSHYNVDIFSIEKGAGNKSVALDHTVEGITCAISIWARIVFLIFAFVGRLFCIEILIDHCSPSLDLNILSFTFLLFFATHLLEFYDDLFELIEGPIVKVVASLFGLENVLLKLLGIVVFLNDLLEEELLFIFLVVHWYD